MIRLSALFWLILVSAMGFAMFAVKYEVQALADQLARTTKQADDTASDIRALDADWAYLNRPDALAQMNQRYLSLVPIATKQLIPSVTDIPMRPPPPPPIETAAAEITPPQSQAPAPSRSPVAQSAGNQMPVRAQPGPSRLAQSAGPAAAASADTRLAAPAPARPVLIKAAARSSLAQHSPAWQAKSLDQLIAQVVESRQ